MFLALSKVSLMWSEPHKGRPDQLKTASHGAMPKVTLGGRVINDARGIGGKENRLGLDLLNLGYRNGNFYGIGNTHLQLRRNHHTGNS